MTNRFPKSVRLRTRRHYHRMTQGAFRYTGQWIVVALRQNKRPSSRLGITATRRYGSACKRNRFKRIVREAFRLCSPQFLESFDILVRPRSLAVLATMSDVQNELLLFIDQETRRM